MTRRGSIYLMVLVTGMVVAMLGLAGVMVQRRVMERSEEAMRVQRASALARSAVELGLQRIADNNNWRNTLGSGAWYDRVPASGDRDSGTLSLWVADPTDNNIADCPHDPVVFTGMGEYGRARRAYSVLYEQMLEPLACLEVAACFGNDLSFRLFSTTVGAGIIHTNGSSSALSAQVHTPVRSKSSASGVHYQGGKVTGVKERAVPKVRDIETLYKAMGATTISRNSLPRRSGVYYLENTVLSPNHNPFGGGTNPLGIYFINMGNEPLIIQNVRIYGTLLICEPKKDSSKVQGSGHFAPVIDGYPSLVVTKQGMIFAMSSSPLSESAVGVNFNPPGAPYHGHSDSDLNDTYESVIHGIVMVEKEVTIASGHTRFAGHLVSEDKLDVQTAGTLQLDGGTDSYDHPPPGFSTPGDFVITRWDRHTD